eukprot:6196716-Pleurochrysis_carterae.AAC.3
MHAEPFSDVLKLKGAAAERAAAQHEGEHVAQRAVERLCRVRRQRTLALALAIGVGGQRSRTVQRTVALRVCGARWSATARRHGFT